MKELRAAVGLETRESSAEKDRGAATTAPTGQPNGTSSSPE
jgi:hypothetical protein